LGRNKTPGINARILIIAILSLLENWR